MHLFDAFRIGQLTRLFVDVPQQFLPIVATTGPAKYKKPRTEAWPHERTQGKGSNKLAELVSSSLSTFIKESTASEVSCHDHSCQWSQNAVILLFDSSEVRRGCCVWRSCAVRRLCEKLSRVTGLQGTGFFGSSREAPAEHRRLHRCPSDADRDME